MDSKYNGTVHITALIRWCVVHACIIGCLIYYLTQVPQKGSIRLRGQTISQMLSSPK